MEKWFQTVTDLTTGAEVLRRQRYGVIEIRDGQLVAIRLRPWPKFASLLSIVAGQLYHRHMPGDRVRVFYNQPRRHPNFLALKFAVSSHDTTWASVRRALETLDEIARIKGSVALLCEAAYFRISDRALAREGWERHTKSRWRRNYIKRFSAAYSDCWSGLSSSQVASFKNRILRDSLAEPVSSLGSS